MMTHLPKHVDSSRKMSYWKGDFRRMSTHDSLSSLLYHEEDRQPCPECQDENGLPGISCWAKKFPPTHGINKKVECIWHFDPYGNLITMNGDDK